MDLIIEIFAKYGDQIDNLKWGESFTIKCPRCEDGIVTISKSLWMVCDKCGILMLQ